ncbi:hypothetical protein [Streptomyces pinistramenti]|uniref:hypothetical protein n=1 Tax=Streptomyces pinistramenti TaxID=2884812 RepID=UPI001D0866D9|nr:hypothetical protein [Streptomyces pinistramenti]MCB5910339.1 hypothetical protein [Streptomyces pinistramenti]
MLELYNLRAPAAADETATRRERDRALHLVETRWEALDTAPNSHWIAAHHNYVKAVHEARTAIQNWRHNAIRLWGAESVRSLPPLHQEVYQRRVLDAGHPDVDTLQTNPTADAERLTACAAAASRGGRGGRRVRWYMPARRRGSPSAAGPRVRAHADQLRGEEPSALPGVDLQGVPDVVVAGVADRARSRHVGRFTLTCLNEG